MIRFYKFITCSLIIWVSFAAQAATEWPPDFKTEAEKQEYFAKILEVYPWTATYHGHFDSFYQGVVNARTQMKQIEGADAVLEARPPLLRFKVLRVTQKEAKGQVVNRLIQYSASVMSQNSTEGKLNYIRNQLQRKGRFQGALTGILRHARKISKQVYAAGNPIQQMQILQANTTEIDEEELLENFRFEEFDMTNKPSSLNEILVLVENLRRDEEASRSALLTLLAQHKSMQYHLLSYESLQDFRAEAEDVLSQYGIEDSKARSDLIDQTARLSFEEGAVMINSKIFEPAFVLQELAVFPALYRGCVGSDCSTSTSYIFPVSPFERVFTISRANGELPVGYAAGVTLTSGGKSTFYLRDVASDTLTAGEAGLLLAAFHTIKQELGVEQIALATRNVLASLSHNQGIQTEIHKWSGEQSPLVFNPVDVQIRQQVLEKLASSSYDAVRAHQTGHILKALPQMSSVQVEFLDGSGKELLPPEKLNKSELHAALQVGIADANLAKRRVHPDQFASFQILCEALANSDRVSLDDFYKRIEEALKPFDVSLSQHLIRDWKELFAKGHLRAQDAMTSSVDAWSRHTIDFVLELILRTSDAEMAYELIAKHVKAFEASDKFIKLLSTWLNPRDPENPPNTTIDRLQRLHKAGLVFHRAYELSEAEIEFLAKQGFGEAKAERLKQKIEGWSSKKKLEINDYIEIAKLLDNEDMEDTSPSAWALQLLIQHKPKHEQILQELYRTFRYDDNLEFALPAALLFLELADKKTAKKYTERAVKKLLKYKDDKELSPDLSKQVQAWAKTHKPEEQEESCEDKLTGKEKGK